MPILGTPPRPSGLPAGLPPGTRLGPVAADLGPIPWSRVDDDGVEWHLSTIDGWWEGPDVVGTVTQRPAGHGAWLGPAYFTPRQVMLGGWIVAPDPQRRDAAVAKLSAAAPLAATGVLRVEEYPQSTQSLVRRAGVLKVAKGTRCTAQVQVALLAPDPRRYAVLAEPQSTGLFAASVGGLATPATSPLILPAAPSGGRLLVSNGGNLDAPWTARITGPVTYPRLVHVGTGRVLQFDLVLSAGQYVELDARSGAVRAADGADLSGRIAYGTDWFLLPHGPSEIAYTGISGPTPSVLSFTPLPCWS